MILWAMKQVSPFAVMVVPFGAAWALAAQAEGLADWATFAMSFFVFAGASQFAALELMDGAYSLFTLFLLTFAVNSRHILMGSTVYPDIAHEPLWKQSVRVITLTDVPYAVIQSVDDSAKRVAIIVWGGLVMWITWIIGTGLGLAFGSLLGDPAAWGLDALMPVFFLVMLMGVFKGRESLLPWGGALVVALGWKYSFGGNWHVLAGAVTGGTLHAVFGPRDE